MKSAAQLAALFPVGAYRDADPAGPIRLLPALLGPLGRLGAHALDLAARQGDEYLADPLRLYPVDCLGIKADEVHHGGGFSLLDGLQVALAGLQADHGFLAVE